ncbi:CerR family C-terminal domain-containing protein [Thermogutta sp.]|uniref:CerR family C-terminal domain-containing protein n=1 Tax=Thermogutta sp. TaxID=1962930 RepID=UPI003C7A04F0
MSQFPEDTKSRLLTAAGELFAELGYEGASARQICERAGVNIAAINYHFKSKEHLYVEAVKAAAPLFRPEEADLELRLAEVKKSGDRAQAVQLLADYIRLMTRHMIAEVVPEWKVKLMMREMLEPHEACCEFFRQHIQRNFAILLGILEVLLPEEMPLERKIQTGLSIVAQCVHYRMAHDTLDFLVPPELRDKFTAEDVARHIIEFTFSALGLASPYVTQWTEEADSLTKAGN